MNIRDFLVYLTAWKKNFEKQLIFFATTHAYLHTWMKQKVIKKNIMMNVLHRGHR